MAIPQYIPYYRFDEGRLDQISVAFTSMDADGDGEAVSFFPYARDIGKSIDQIECYFNSVTTPGLVNARVERMAADGTPSGTLAAAGSESTVNISALGEASFPIDTPYALQNDDDLCLVIERPAGSSFVGSTRAIRRSPYRDVSGNFPVISQNTSGSWVKQFNSSGNANKSTILGRFSNGLYLPSAGSSPIYSNSVTAQFFTGVELGFKFRTTQQAKLASFCIQSQQTDTQFLAVVGNASYSPGDTGATVLTQRAFSYNYHPSDPTTSSEIPFNDEITIVANEWYYVVLRWLSGGFPNGRRVDCRSDARKHILGVPPGWDMLAVRAEGGPFVEYQTWLPVGAIGFFEIGDNGGGGNGIKGQAGLGGYI